jgi:hypothetical protein
MKKTRYILAFLLAVAFGNSSAIFADNGWHSSPQDSFYYNEGPRACAMPCARPCPPPPPAPPCPIPCQMPCCPPQCQPMPSCCPPPCFDPCMACPSPCIPVCGSKSCWGDFYLGGNFFRLELTANRQHSRGVEEFFGTRSKHHNSHELRATMRGTTIGYEYSRPCRLYQNLEFNWAIGKAKPQHHKSCNDEERYLHYYEAHLLLGYVFPFGCENSYSFIPYSGLGYRYVDHDLLVNDQNMRYRTYYAPVGAKLNFNCNEFMTIGFRGEWIIPLDATVRLSDLDAVRFVLQRKSSYMLELPISYRLCGSNLEFIVSPFYRYFVDGSSHRLKQRNCWDRKLPEQVNREWGGQILVGVKF